MSKLTFRADINEPVKLEIFLRRDMQVSRRLLAKCKYQGEILRNGCHIRTVDTVFPNDEIVLISPDKDGTALPNVSLKVPVLYRGEHIIVYNKPPFMPCHQSMGHYTDTLANAFAAEYKGVPFRCITRLDRNTSGVCIAALTPYGAGYVQGMVKKEYIAAAEGIITESGVIDAPIARKEISVIQRCVSKEGKPALTRYFPLYSNEKYTLIKLIPETGRTHQLRVHMAYIGHPLAGDELYGVAGVDIGRHALHCLSAEFPEPETGNIIKVKAPMPHDMRELFGECFDFEV
ncbi:MAG: RluA family pseudouridine synthase [Ruminococcus sp.]